MFVFYFRGLFRHLDATVFFADALSVGLFALAGASKAFSLEQGFVLSIILGAITAVGGGAVRDICVGETPGIFQQSNFYAVAGLGGSFAFVMLAYAGCPLPIAGAACVFAVVFLRYWSVYFDWKTRNDADLTPHVARGLGQGEARGIGRVPARRDATVRSRSAVAEAAGVAATERTSKIWPKTTAVIMGSISLLRGESRFPSSVILPPRNRERAGRIRGTGRVSALPPPSFWPFLVPVGVTIR